MKVKGAKNSEVEEKEEEKAGRIGRKSFDFSIIAVQLFFPFHPTITNWLREQGKFSFKVEFSGKKR